MSITIRTAETADALAIARLNRLSLGYDYPEDATRENLCTILQSPSDQVYVAVSGDEVVGYVHACAYQTLYAPPMKNIMGIAVDPTRRREGIGTLLLSAVERWAGETGAAAIRLVSGAGRTDAHSFYRCLGFDQGRDQRNFKKYLSGTAQQEAP